MMTSYNPCYDPYMEHIETIVDQARTAKALGLEMDVMKLRELFYAQHKAEHGSGKVYDGESYVRFMTERYIHIECAINTVMEAKLEYERRGKEWRGLERIGEEGKGMERKGYPKDSAFRR